MKIPHQDPLVFAKEILEINEENSKVLCSFKELPTLAVFVEASAQASAAFFQNSGYELGYLANALKIELLDDIEDLDYIVNLQKILSFDNLRKYSFFVTNISETKRIVSGEFTVALD